MRSLLITFLALSLVIGPLQQVGFADNTNTSSQARLERVFLVSLLNRTRLFEVINASIFQVENQCLHRDPQTDQVTVEQQGNCPQIVNRMREQINANYADIMKLYIVYNLLKNAQKFMNALTYDEALGYGWGPPTVSLQQLRFVNPYADLFVPAAIKFHPTSEDIYHAASEIQEMTIGEPCSGSATVGMCPSKYDMSFTGFMQKECHDYIMAHAAEASSLPWDERWPANPLQICDQFRLTYNTNTQIFSFALPPNAVRDSSGHILHGAQQNLFREVIADGIIKDIWPMMTYAQARLTSLISMEPFVILVNSSNPSLSELKTAVEKVASQAQKNENEFEKTFEKLQKNPGDQSGYLALLKRAPVVQNLLEYPSPDMQQEADPQVFQNVYQELMNRHGLLYNLSLDGLKFSPWVVGSVGFIAACTAFVKDPPACGWALSIAFTGAMVPFLVEDYNDFNSAFGEFFSGTTIGDADSEAFKQSPKLARIDSSVTDPNFQISNTALNDLESLDSAHAQLVVNAILTFGGIVPGLAFSRLSKFMKVIDSDPEIRAQYMGRDAAQAKNVIKFYLRLDPLHLRAASVATIVR